MEFIPLEKYSKKRKKTVTEDFEKDGKKKKLKKAEITKDETLKKAKGGARTKVLEKKAVKNKYRETLTLKRKKKSPKKKTEKESDEIEEEQEEEDDDNVEEEEVEGEDDDTVEDDHEEEKNDEEAFKRKCQEMDEKKKNRLFLKLKKKIYSEAEIKELHPDIRGVIFPRKKKSRWCWAVFASEERADEALKKLIKNKEVYATKPNPYDKVDMRRKEKMKVVMRKKEARKKLQQMWS